MLITRYSQIREDLIKLWKHLRFQSYYLYFPRTALMSLDQLENVEHRTFTDSNDHGYLNRPTLQKASIEDLIDIIPRVGDPKLVAYRNPRDAIVIYETIQRYITLWLDIITQAPEFAHPPIKNFYALEEVAKWAFTQYKIEKIRKNREDGKLQTAYSDIPLMSLITGLNKSMMHKDEELSFTSHLDDRLPSNLQGNRPNEIDSILSWGDPSAFNNQMR